MSRSSAHISRRTFIKVTTTAGMSVLAWPRFNREINAILLAAGNTDDEKERYRLLQSLEDHPQATAELRNDLKKILPIAVRWAEGRGQALHEAGEESSYLFDFFNKPIREGMFPDPIPQEAPLFPFWCLYRGRLLVWVTIQHGSLLHVEERREANYEEAQRLLEIASQAFPQNKIIEMYLGKPMPWNASFSPDPKAPEWASLQRECLEKLTDIIHWWIDNRQLPDGQYGGGWGDDVEMWRWWTPVLVGFEDEKIIAAQQKLSNGLFDLSRMEGGYTNRVDDVEHTAEDSADTITAMMHINPDDPVWKTRAVRLAELMQEKWTGINERGQLQFKSTYFSANEVDSSARRACDTVYHPRAVQPALLYWQRSGDKKLGKLFSAWMHTWVEASMREERGKPSGIIPSAIHWPEGFVGGVGKNWWKPENYTDNPLYVWPSSMSMMCNTMLLTYYMSREAKYLAPIKAMASLYMENGNAELSESPAGSLAWCTSQMNKFLPETLAKYSQLTHDPQFEALLKQEGNGYVKYRVTGEANPLLHELKKNTEAFRWNYPAYTSEVRWTDRILNFSTNYLHYTSARHIPRFDADFMYSMLTGDMGGALYFPMNVVRWLTNPRSLAALVEGWHESSLTASLYHFGSSERHMKVRIFLLKEGNYRFVLSNDESEVIEEKVIKRNSRSTDISFGLPPSTLCKLKLEII
ncbi:hypothetical protein OKW21_005311 [Catalinimonas alkaloidigena]|uniref:hypothetical protein n=1 Tax=Catalinimonas alkaloidigena TaxID=1075417 RepID=UPI002406300D|nr:hypothetical protein [Catalinimonas alkaloidigena]MDF9800048.1 hypothetical protein [Catalinimonas alkaloidigena]